MRRGWFRSQGLSQELGTSLPEREPAFKCRGCVAGRVPLPATSALASVQRPGHGRAAESRQVILLPQPLGQDPEGTRGWEGIGGARRAGLGTAQVQ